MLPKRVAQPKEAVKPNYINKYDYLAPTALNPVSAMNGAYAQQKRNEMLANIYKRQELGSMLDPGLNDNVVEPYQDKLGFDDTAMRRVFQTAGAGAGALAAGKTIAPMTFWGGVKAGGAIGSVAGPKGAVVGGVIGGGVGAIGAAAQIIAGAFIGAAAGGTLTPSGMYSAADHGRRMILDTIQNPMSNAADTMYAFGNTMDQLDGAAIIKSGVRSLTSDEHDSFIENVKRAYGVHEEGLTPMDVADIRKDLEIDLGFGNYVVDLVGELAASPSIWNIGAMSGVKRGARTSSTAELAARRAKGNDWIAKVMGPSDMKRFGEIALENTYDSGNAFRLFKDMLYKNKSVSSYLGKNKILPMEGSSFMKQIRNKTLRVADDGQVHKYDFLTNSWKSLEPSEVASMNDKILREYMDDLSETVLGKTEGIIPGVTYNYRAMREGQKTGENIAEMMRNDSSFDMGKLGTILKKNIEKSGRTFNKMDYDTVLKTYPHMRKMERLDDLFTSYAFRYTNPVAWGTYRFGKDIKKVIRFSGVEKLLQKVSRGRMDRVSYKKLDDGRIVPKSEKPDLTGLKAVYDREKENLKIDRKRAQQEIKDAKSKLDTWYYDSLEEINRRQKEWSDEYKALKDRYENARGKLNVVDENNNPITKEQYAYLKRRDSELGASLKDMESKGNKYTQRYNELSKQKAMISKQIESYDTLELWKKLGAEDIEVYHQIKLTLESVRARYNRMFRQFKDELLMGTNKQNIVGLNFKKALPPKVIRENGTVDWEQAFKNVNMDVNKGEVVSSYGAATNSEISKAFRKYLHEQTDWDSYVTPIRSFVADAQSRISDTHNDFMKNLKQKVETDPFYNTIGGELTSYRKGMGQTEMDTLRESLQKALQENDIKYASQEEISSQARVFKNTEEASKSLTKDTQDYINDLLADTGVDLENTLARGGDSTTITKDQWEYIPEWNEEMFINNFFDDVYDTNLHFREIAAGDIKGEMSNNVRLQAEELQEELLALSESELEDTITDLLSYRFRTANDPSDMSVPPKNYIDFEYYDDEAIDAIFKTMLDDENFDIPLKKAVQRKVHSVQSANKIFVDFAGEGRMSLFNFITKHGRGGLAEEYERLFNNINVASGGEISAASEMIKTSNSKSIKDIYRMMQIEREVLKSFPHQQINRNIIQFDMLNNIERTRFLEPMIEALSGNVDKLSGAGVYETLGGVMRNAYEISDYPKMANMVSELKAVKAQKDFQLGLLRHPRYSRHFKKDTVGENFFMGAINDMNYQISRMQNSGRFLLDSNATRDKFAYDLPNELRKSLEEKYMKDMSDKAGGDAKKLKAFKEQFDDAVHAVTEDFLKRFDNFEYYEGVQFNGEMNRYLIDHLYNVFTEISEAIPKTDAEFRQTMPDVESLETLLGLRKDIVEIRNSLIESQRTVLRKYKLYNDQLLLDSYKPKTFHSLQAAGEIDQRMGPATFSARVYVTPKDIAEHRKRKQLFFNTFQYSTDEFHMEPMPRAATDASGTKNLATGKDLKNDLSTPGQLRYQHDKRVAADRTDSSKFSFTAQLQGKIMKDFLSKVTDDPYGFIEILKRQRDLGEAKKNMKYFLMNKQTGHITEENDQILYGLHRYLQAGADSGTNVRPYSFEELEAAYGRHVQIKDNSSADIKGWEKANEEVGKPALQEKAKQFTQMDFVDIPDEATNIFGETLNISAKGSDKAAHTISRAIEGARSLRTYDEYVTRMNELRPQYYDNEQTKEIMNFLTNNDIDFSTKNAYLNEKLDEFNDLNPGLVEDLKLELMKYHETGEFDFEDDAVKALGHMIGDAEIVDSRSITIRKKMRELLQKQSEKGTLTKQEHLDLEELNKLSAQMDRGIVDVEGFDIAFKKIEDANGYGIDNTKKIEELGKAYNEELERIQKREAFYDDIYGKHTNKAVKDEARSMMDDLRVEDRDALIKRLEDNKVEKVGDESVREFVDRIIREYKQKLKDPLKRLNDVLFNNYYQPLDMNHLYGLDNGYLSRNILPAINVKGNVNVGKYRTGMSASEELTREQFLMDRQVREQEFLDEIQDVLREVVNREQGNGSEWIEGSYQKALHEQYQSEMYKKATENTGNGYDQIVNHKIDHFENMMTLTLGDIKNMFATADDFVDFVKNSDEMVFAAIVKDDSGAALSASKFRTLDDGTVAYKKRFEDWAPTAPEQNRQLQFTMDMDMMRKHKEGYYDKGKPTVKEIVFKNDAEIRELFETNDPALNNVGMMSVEAFKNAKQMSYKALKLPKALDFYYKNLLSVQKADMLLSAGWNPTNFVDAMSRNSQGLESLYDAKEYTRLFVETNKFYNLWHSNKQFWFKRSREVKEQIDDALRRNDAATARKLRKELNLLKGDSLTKSLRTYYEGRLKDSAILDELEGKSKYNTSDVIEKAYKELKRSKEFVTADKKTKKQMLDERVDDLFSIVEEVDRFEQTSATTDMPTYLDKMTNGKLEEATGMTRKMARFLARENPVMKANMSIASWIEQTGRLHGYLLDRHLYGHGHEKSLARSLRRHFDYSDKGMLEIYATMVFPFIAFPTRNMMFWAEQLQDAGRARRYTATIEALWGSVDTEDNDYLEYMRMQGFIPIGNKLLKIGDSRQQAWRVGTALGNTAQSRINPYIRESVSALKGNKSVGESLLSATPLVRRIPRAVDRWKQREQRSPVETLLPSLFGSYYERSSNTYRSRNNTYQNLYDSGGRFRNRPQDGSSYYRIRSIMYQNEQRRYR